MIYGQNSWVARRRVLWNASSSPVNSSPTSARWTSASPQPTDGWPKPWPPTAPHPHRHPRHRRRRAATILSIVGDVSRFPTKGHFAAFSDTAPLDASSGDVKRHRLSRRGNRQLNKVLHTAAKTQIRRGGLGRSYYDRKITEGKSSIEALRALKRQLSDVVYRRLVADQQQREAARGGQMRTRPKSA
jgi:hypothetical protein